MTGEPPDWVLEGPPLDGEAPHSARPDDSGPETVLDEIDRDYEEQSGGFGDPLDILGNAEVTGSPRLTPDCVPAVVYNYAMAEGDRLIADPVPIAMHCLAACSLAISDAWRIKPKQHDRWTQQARLWVCNIKPPGARGTDMLRAAFWPIEAREARLRQEFQREMAAWKEQTEGMKPKEIEEHKRANPEPKQKRLVTNDATVEALSQLLEGDDSNAKIGYCADELATFLDFGRYKNGKSGGGGRAAILQAYDGGPQQIDRVMRGSVFVANWSVVAAGNIQPRKLEEMGAELASDGLFQRFVVVHSREAELYEDDDQPTDQAAGAAYSDVIERLMDMAPPAGADDRIPPCLLGEDGRAVRQGVMRLVQRLQHDRSMPDVIREAASKWSGLFARLTLIFHLIDCAHRLTGGEKLADRDLIQIKTESAEQAATMIRTIVLPNLLRLGFETLPDGKEQASARWIAEHILARKLAHVTAREIGRACRQLRGKQQSIALSMEILNDAGWTAQTEARADGIRWKINPAVHQKFAAAAEAEKQRRLAVRELIKRKVSEL